MSSKNIYLLIKIFKFFLFKSQGAIYYFVTKFLYIVHTQSSVYKLEDKISLNVRAFQFYFSTIIFLGNKKMYFY